MAPIAAEFTTATNASHGIVAAAHALRATRDASRDESEGVFLLRPRMLPLGDLPKIGSRTWTRWASCEAGESAYNPQRAATSRSMLAHWQATHNKHSHYALLRCALLVACLLRRMVRDRKRAAFVVTVF